MAKWCTGSKMSSAAVSGVIKCLVKIKLYKTVNLTHR